MVNTFLTDADFSVSAKALDSKRLNAQCNESFILLNLLRWLDKIIAHFQLDIPELTDVRADKPIFSAWLKELRNRYLREGPLPDESEKRTKFGYLFHPALRMWLGHTALLEQYHRAHLVEWLARGYKSTRPMPAEVPVENLSRPYWISDRRWHRNFQLALLFKAPEYYETKFETRGEVFDGYLW